MDFDTIYAHFHPAIVRYLSRFVGRHEAEDLSQEVFVRVGRGLPAFRGESRVSTWIYRIATNTALDRLRNPSFRQEAAEETDGGLSAEYGDGLGHGERSGRRDGLFPVERQVIRKEMNACIRSRIETLPEPYRSVLVMSDLAGFSNPEIARLLDVSLETVKIRLHRARARLKGDLESQCTLYHDERNELACDRK
ncbi:MAG: sigma-70 family RNA polymerase sigma factor [Candidatus Deferrimicrobiaceae bacterium]